MKSYLALIFCNKSQIKVVYVLYFSESVIHVRSKSQNPIGANGNSLFFTKPDVDSLSFIPLAVYNIIILLVCVKIFSQNSKCWCSPTKYLQSAPQKESIFSCHKLTQKMEKQSTLWSDLFTSVTGSNSIWEGNFFLFSLADSSMYSITFVLLPFSSNHRGDSGTNLKSIWWVSMRKQPMV